MDLFIPDGIRHTWDPPLPSDGVRDTGIDVIVVGAGFGGIACAVECKRKGHRVMIFEKVPELKQLGDLLSLGVNAGRILARWGLHEKLLSISAQASDIRIHDYLGGLIQVQKTTWPLFGAYAYRGHRARLHEVLFEHAKSLGIEIRMGKQVVEYWEDEANGKAGVKIQTGESFDADVIIAADGVKSFARQFVIVRLSSRLPVDLPDNIDEGVPRQPKTFWLRYLPRVVRC